MVVKNNNNLSACNPHSLFVVMVIDVPINIVMLRGVFLFFLIGTGSCVVCLTKLKHEQITVKGTMAQRQPH